MTNQSKITPDGSWDKAELRSRMRRLRSAMTPEQIEAESEQLGRALAEHPLYRSARAVYGYLPVHQEVRTEPMLRRAMEDGKRVAVPRVCGKEIRFFWLEDLSAVRPGFAGIPEPEADAVPADDPHALVLLPGLAFDRRGYRTGYGGGYYDRFLSREPDHPTLALCYGFQLVEKLNEEAFDVPADCVLHTDAKEETI